MHRYIKGIAASPGLVIGPAYIYKPDQLIIPKYCIMDNRIDAEINLFKDAVQKTKKELQQLQSKVAQKISQNEAGIFSAHMYVLEDPLLESKTIEAIKKNKKNAAWALEEVTQSLFKAMSEIEDSYISERAVDILDIGKRILSHLVNEKDISLKDLIDKPSVIVAHNLLPSETAQFDKSKILGIITEVGSSTSHVAILARALQVPALVGTENACSLINNEHIIALDGLLGEALILPSKEEINKFHIKKKNYQKIEHELFKLQQLPALTKSGTNISVKVNLEIEEEIEIIAKYSHEGIGLCRTEFLYMDKDQYPDEDMQYEIYAKIVMSLDKKEVTFRTLDIGGDKLDPKFYKKLENEINPSLGCRGIRLSLRFPEIFITQLKAILRVSVLGPVRIMFPMISGLSDFIQAKNFIEQAKEELESEGHSYDPNIKIGIMIEVPSAAITVDILARHVDFMSIGTNDLTQYVLASDRMNPEVANLYTPNHPAMIRILNQIIKGANELDCPVSICGEMASDEKFIPLLIGMGLREFSVSPRFVPKVKDIIRNMDDSFCENSAAKILSLETIEQVEKNIRSIFHEVWLSL